MTLSSSPPWGRARWSIARRSPDGLRLPARFGDPARKFPVARRVQRGTDCPAQACRRRSGARSCRDGRPTSVPRPLATIAEGHVHQTGTVENNAGTEVLAGSRLGASRKRTSTDSMRQLPDHRRACRERPRCRCFAGDLSAHTTSRSSRCSHTGDGARHRAVRLPLRIDLRKSCHRCRIEPAVAPDDPQATRALGHQHASVG